MSSAPTPAEIVRDAKWLAQALDPETGLLRVVEMDREAYREASFLDDRLLQQPHSAGVVPWDAIAGAIVHDARRDARWIFHIGHVGSTLVARLLGELERVLSVREPRILRDLALEPSDLRARYMTGTQALMSRTFEADQAALVKATSLCSEIAAELMPEDARALFLYAKPEAYIATILAGENSVRELELLAPLREERLAGRGIALTDAGKSDAHRAATAWACEMTALEAAAEASGTVVLWADFDSMLADMPGALADAAVHLGFEATPDRLGAIATGPLMRRYSKALEYDYSPELRRDLLDDAARTHGADIRDALGMLGDAAGRSPLLARALERAEGES
jgi:hypothetical protein